MIRFKQVYLKWFKFNLNNSPNPNVSLLTIRRYLKRIGKVNTVSKDSQNKK